MERKIIITASILGLLAIIFGAFGAHALKKVLQTEALNSFEAGVRYQMYHALFLLFVANIQLLTLKEKVILFYLTLAGVILFSGSIYILSTAAISGIKARFLGPVTPVGGLFLIASWGYLIVSILSKKNI